MALDYTALFTDLGKIIGKVNSYNTLMATTLPADRDAIAAEVSTFLSIVGRCQTTYDGAQRNIRTLRQQLASLHDARLQDKTTVLDQLSLVSSSMSGILLALIRDMGTTSNSITANTVTLGSTTAASGNNGTGLVFVSSKLDGFSAPGRGMAPCQQYNGLASQLAVPTETVTLECVADDEIDHVGEGNERWSLKGGAIDDKLGFNTEGSGQGSGVNTSNFDTSLLQNKDLETWSTNTPGSWTLTTGSAGVTKESTTIFRGTYALKFAGNAALLLDMNQAISPSRLSARRRYLCSFAVKASAVPAAGVLTVGFTGTGYSQTAPTNDVWDVQISGTPTGGTYTISFVGPTGGTKTTAALAFNASSVTVQTAVRALKGYECAVVATQAGAVPDITHRITFYGVPGSVTVTADITALTGGTPAKTLTHQTTGVEGDSVGIPAAGMPTGWFTAWFWINMPSTVPDDWKLSVAITGPLSNAVNVFLDSFVLTPAIYFGGHCLAVVAGSTRWLRGDRITWTVANTTTGNFQHFFRRWYGVQLPTSGSPTISNALAA